MAPAPVIGVLTTSFPRFEGDLAGNFVFGLARALAGRGYGIEVVAPEPDGQTDWWGDPAWLSGVRVIAAPYARPRRRQSLFYGAGVPDNLSASPLNTLLIPPAVISLIATARVRARGWHAVMSHWLLPSAFAAGLTRRRAQRHLAIAHSGDVHLLSRLPARSGIAALLLRCADRIGFVSAALMREFIGLLDASQAHRFEARAALTPMGIDIASLHPSKTRAALRRAQGLGNRFTVLFLGRLVPIKGADRLIDALKGLDAVELVVAGDGPQRGRLESRARRLGIRARFTGAVDTAGRADLLAVADVLVLPSRVLMNGRHEGLPLVLIEALGAGVPIIASRTGAVEEIITHKKSGLIVADEGISPLREALQALQSDSGLTRRLRSAGPALAATRDWQALVPLYERLLLGLT